jgi:2-isopropylmalate synthase
MPTLKSTSFISSMQTVGVSANIVDASFEALLDAINWKLVRDMKVPA